MARPARGIRQGTSRTSRRGLPAEPPPGPPPASTHRPRRVTAPARRREPGFDAWLAQEGHAHPGLVIDAITPAALASLLNACGHAARVRVSPEGHPVVFAGEETPWLVHLPWRVDGTQTYGALHFYRVLLRSPVVDSEVINRVNHGLLFGKVVVDEDGDLAVTMDVRLDGGVTPDWLVRAVSQWGEVVSEVEDRLRVAKEDMASLVAAAQLVSAKGMLRD